MLRRVLAAVVAIVLAVLGAVLVMSYASSADERAQAGLETVDVLVAAEAIPVATPAEEMASLVETRSLPRTAVPEGAVADLAEVEDQVAGADILPGETLVRGRFTSAEQQRTEGGTPLPEGSEDLHQVTVQLDKARALGGNITRGDTVGVFLSFEVEETGEDSAGRSTNTTHLTLHKVPVVRVEGASLSGEQVEGGLTEEAPDAVFVTLALEPEDAESLVFGMEWGHVWLSQEPESADGEGEIVIMQFPESGRDVYQ